MKRAVVRRAELRSSSTGRMKMVRAAAGNTHTRCTTWADTSPVSPHSHAATQTRRRADSQTHGRTDARTHRRTDAQTRSRTDAAAGNTHTRCTTWADTSPVSPHSHAATQTRRRADSQTHGRTDARTHGRTDARSHRRTVARTHRLADTRSHRRTDSQTHGRTDARPHRRTDSQTHGRTDARTHGRTDAQTRSRTDAQTHGRTVALSHSGVQLLAGGWQRYNHRCKFYMSAAISIEQCWVHLPPCSKLRHTGAISTETIKCISPNPICSVVNLGQLFAVSRKFSIT